jgi:HK97 gp10 family phage protein
MSRTGEAELQGQDALRRMFADLSDSARREVAEVVRDSAEEVKREAVARVRVRTGETQKSIFRKSTGRGLSAEVGSSYTGRFLEFGTVRQPARPFLFPALEIVRPRFFARIQAAVYGVARSVGR